VSTSIPAVGSFVGENDKYRVVRVIGEGGMGVVFEAEHTLTQKRVALKWMLPALASTPDLAARFLREAQAAARVRHPNVVDVYDYGKHGEAAYLVMEYLEGETLSAALRRGDLPLPTLIGLLLPALRAVAAAHKQGVIHRDIKPDNIFLSRHEELIEAKVLDFGISKVEARGAQAVSLTRTGTAMGTPHYMSYEQLVGEKLIDGRTDVYAFGVILYEMLTGRLPFEAETFSALIVKVATTEPLPPVQLRADVPLPLQEIVQWAMVKNRDQRCPSMDALISALEPFAAFKGAPSYTSSPQASASAVSRKASAAEEQSPAPAASTLTSTKARSRTPAIVATILSALFALGAATYFLLERRTPSASNQPAHGPTTPAAPALPGAPAVPAALPVAAEKPHSEGKPAPLPAVEAHGTSPASHPHSVRKHAESAHEPSTHAASADERSESPTQPTAEPATPVAPKPLERDRYVTPDGRRIMRAPTLGSAPADETPRAPYTGNNGRVIIPAP
jgi:eukaryotic-like serine/threonine-protein kinase